MVKDRAPPSGLPNDVLTKYEPRIKSCFEEERKQIDEKTTSMYVRLANKKGEEKKKRKKERAKGKRKKRGRQI